MCGKKKVSEVNLCKTIFCERHSLSYSGSCLVRLLLVGVRDVCENIFQNMSSPVTVIN
jgi:hypothetical protein